MLSIIGPGGVGGVIAAVAGHAGHDVEVVATDKTADIINETGIRLESAQFGAMNVRVPARTVPSAGSSIIIATKAYSLPDIAPVVTESEPVEVLALCNGVSHVDQVHSFEADRVTCGSIKIVSERLRPGEIAQYSKFSTIEVEDDADSWEVVVALRDIGFTVDTGGTEMEVLWRKLRFLAPMALLTASTGKLLGPAMAGSDELVAEMAALATASGLATTPDEIFSYLHRVSPDSDSSLGRDVTAGNKTEIDALGYDLLRKGEAFGIPTPAIAKAVQAIEERLS